MTRFIAIGCFHGEFSDKLFNEIRNLKPDIILSFGDYCGSKKFHKIIFKEMRKGNKIKNVISDTKMASLMKKEKILGKNVIRKLRKLNVPVYGIFGNHDDEVESFFRRYRIFRNVHRKTFNFEGVRIAGYGGQVEIDAYLKTNVLDESKNNKKIRKSVWGRNRKELKKMNLKDIDIFMAHYPAVGYFDKILNKGSGKMYGKSGGFSGYNDVIKNFKPRVFLNAHMHEYQGIKKYKNTYLASIGAAMNNKFILLDINKDKIKIKLIGKGKNRIY
jgi:Icc-related predicted phosphoesterase